MSIKRYRLLIVILAIMVSSIAFSGCTLLYGNNGSFEDLGDDYLLWESSGLENRTLRISKSGYAEYVEFGSTYGTERLIEYKTGQLSEQDMEKLSEYIENIGFFRLRNAYHSSHNICVEAAWGLSVFRDGKVKSVYEYGIDAPEAFYDAVYYLYDIIRPQLQDVSRYGTFIKAEKKDNYLKGSEINNLSEENLKSHPFLAEAIQNPGWLIHVGSLDNTELEDYITQDRNYFFLSFEGSNFHVKVYERQK